MSLVPNAAAAVAALPSIHSSECFRPFDPGKVGLIICCAVLTGGVMQQQQRESVFFLECARRAIRGMLYADDVFIVSRSPRGLERTKAVFVEVSSAFGLTIPESKTETTCMPIPHAPATQTVFNATGQQYRQTTSFTYLGGAVTETPNLSIKIDRQVRAGWMNFRRYTR